MTHDSAVQTIVSLAPEIKKRGGVEVLTEHAQAEDLPPAQLEKLAQVYNTLRTISHVDNAEPGQRGETVDLIDVPELVVGYATGLDQEKAALHPLSVGTHDPSTVDLNFAMRGELAPQQEKAAAEVSGAPDQVEKTFSKRLDREKSADAFLDLSIDLQEEISKMACELFTAAPEEEDFVRDISLFEKEALQKQPEAVVKAAGDYLEKFAKPHHTTLIRHDYEGEPLKKYAYDIPHQYGDTMAAMGDLLGVFELVKLAADGDEAAITSFADAIAGSPDADLDLKDIVTDEEAAATAGDDILEAMEGEGLASSTEQAEPTRQSIGSSDKRSGGGGGGSSPSAHGKGVSAEDVVRAIKAPISATAAGVRGAAVKADETLGKIVGKERQNSAQKATDMSVEDIKRSMMVQRLIGTDPVLKEQDSREVLEIYNSIAQKNPEIASDPASLRLLLREAASYEGLTLDSQKMLSEVRRNSEQGDKESQDNDRRRYASGGVNPLSIVNS